MMYSWTIKAFVYSSVLFSLTVLNSMSVFSTDIMSCLAVIKSSQFILSVQLQLAVTILLGKYSLSHAEDFLFCKFPVQSYPAETHCANLPLFLSPVQYSEHLSLAVPSKFLFMLV